MSAKSNNANALESQRKLILDAKAKGKLPLLGAFCKLSGPGWMQSATTLGGGTLASALYLGVLGGFGFMWLQPLAMMLGIVMLAAISYVTLSIKDKPLQAINKQISPLLGYGWAGASMFACFVFSMPQFSLAVASVDQNLMAGFFTNPLYAKVGITAFFYILAMIMIGVYAKGGRGVKIFEYFIKGSVAAIVLCFFGVVIQLGISGAINWEKVWLGFIPNFSVLSEPSEDFMQHLATLSDSAKSYWSNLIVGEQRSVVISAAAMAVGINMTFLFPYSMLKKGWNKDFRELAIFDLATGLFIPFLLATSCVVIASATQFHVKAVEGLEDAKWVFVEKKSQDIMPVLACKDGTTSVWKPVDATVADTAKVLALSTKINGKDAVIPAGNLIKSYIDVLDKRLANMLPEAEFKALDFSKKAEKYNSISKSEKLLASMLVKRDASNLSETLAPLVGDEVARYIFGFGVMGMAMNAILMNMLICGLSFSEIVGKSGRAKWQVLGSSLLLISAIVSMFWEGAKMWLVIHSGVIAMIFLPIAYGAFLVIMNSKKVLGEHAPRGKSRFIWNVLMIMSVGASSCASLFVLWTKLGIFGPILFVLFLIAVIISNIILRKKGKV